MATGTPLRDTMGDCANLSGGGGAPGGVAWAAYAAVGGCEPCSAVHQPMMWQEGGHRPPSHAPHGRMATSVRVHQVCGGVVSATVSDVAATGETAGGPRGPSELWLLGQRMEDIRRGQEDLGHRLEKLDAKIDAAAEKLDAKIDSMRNFIIIPVMLVLLAAVLAHFVPGL